MLSMVTNQNSGRLPRPANWRLAKCSKHSRLMDGGVKRLAAQSQNGGRIENVRQYGAEINKMSSTRARAIWGSAVASTFGAEL